MDNNDEFAAPSHPLDNKSSKIGHLILSGIGSRIEKKVLQDDANNKIGFGLFSREQKNKFKNV